MLNSQKISCLNSTLHHPLPMQAKSPQSEYLNLLLMNDILRLVKKSRSTIYRWVDKGLFPPPINIGGTSIAWPEEVIAEWLEQKISESNLAEVHHVRS